MADRREEIRRDLDELIFNGVVLHVKLLLLHGTPEQRAGLQDINVPSTASRLPAIDPHTGDFASDYQVWYSEAMAVTRSVLPERHVEFCEYYSVPKRSKIDVETYGIRDFVNGITVTLGWDGQPAFDPVAAVGKRLQSQMAILGSARRRLDSLLADIYLVLQGELADDELAASRTLLKSNQLRSAGVVAGVVLERHLKVVLAQHAIHVKRNPTLVTLNDALKDASVYDVATWRRIQHLTDIRNLPRMTGTGIRRREVSAMIDAVEQVTKLVA